MPRFIKVEDQNEYAHTSLIQNRFMWCTQTVNIEAVQSVEDILKYYKYSHTCSQLTQKVGTLSRKNFSPRLNQQVVVIPLFHILGLNTKYEGFMIQ